MDRIHCRRWPEILHPHTKISSKSSLGPPCLAWSRFRRRLGTRPSTRTLHSSLHVTRHISTTRRVVTLCMSLLPAKAKLGVLAGALVIRLNALVGGGTVASSTGLVVFLVDGDVEHVGFGFFVNCIAASFFGVIMSAFGAATWNIVLGLTYFSSMN